MNEYMLQYFRIEEEDPAIAIRRYGEPIKSCATQPGDLFLAPEKS